MQGVRFDHIKASFAFKAEGRFETNNASKDINLKEIQPG